MRAENLDLKARYGESERGNFAVLDKIGVPHPFCITAKHVAIAADRFSGMLGSAAIEEAERQRVFCGICKGRLKYHEHETALLVECRVKPEPNDSDAAKELRAYLLKIKPLCEADKLAGFAFQKSWKEEAAA